MYKELDDNELIYMIREDNDYYDIMIEKYRPIIINICKKYEKIGKEIGYELDDLIQIANIGLYDAIVAYRDNQNALFYTFVIRCIKNKLITEIRNQKTNKKIVLNTAISYEAPIKGTDITLLEVIPDKNTLTPFECLVIEENEIEYINFLNSLPFEVAVVFELRISGFTIDEISKFLNMKRNDIFKCINMAKQRVCV